MNLSEGNKEQLSGLSPAFGNLLFVWQANMDTICQDVYTPLLLNKLFKS